jgi:hypothetical protein
MEQAASQANATSYKPGQSGNPQGPPSNKVRAEHIERKARELAAEFGGLDAMTPVDRTLMLQAATLLVRKPRTQVDVVRIANSVSRLLGIVSRRHPREPDRGPSLHEYLASKASAP